VDDDRAAPVTAASEPARLLAMPPRPKRPLSTLALLRAVPANSLAACDEALFEELLVERRFWWGRVVTVSDPDGIRRVLQDNAANYRRVSPVRRAFEFSAGGGMVCLEGKEWTRHRRVINPALDHRALRPDLPALIELAEEMARLLDRVPRGAVVEIGRTLTHLVVRSTGLVFAGDEPEIDEMLGRMGRYPEKYSAFDVLPLPRWLRFIDGFRASRAGIGKYYALLDRLVAERCRPDHAGGRDLLWRLGTAGDRHSGAPLCPAEIRDEVLTLAAAALTPLRPLTWVWYLLALHPAVEQRLHAELDAVLGARAPTPEDLPKLVYLRQVLDETMRLYPPLPVMLRSAIADDVVCGRRVPRRSIVAIMPWVVHRHRALWTDPDRFDPDRFSAERSAERSRYAYIPFGVGPHVCPGAALSMAELLAGLAVLAQRFRFRPVDGQAIEPVAWTTLRARHGIRVTIERR
jgi:cytochrome P450